MFHHQVQGSKGSWFFVVGILLYHEGGKGRCDVGEAQSVSLLSSVRRPLERQIHFYSPHDFPSLSCHWSEKFYSCKSKVLLRTETFFLIFRKLFSKHIVKKIFSGYDTTKNSRGTVTDPLFCQQRLGALGRYLPYRLLSLLVLLTWKNLRNQNNSPQISLRSRKFWTFARGSLYKIRVARLLHTPPPV